MVTFSKIDPLDAKSSGRLETTWKLPGKGSNGRERLLPNQSQARQEPRSPGIENVAARLIG